MQRVIFKRNFQRRLLVLVLAGLALRWFSQTQSKNAARFQTLIASVTDAETKSASAQTSHTDSVRGMVAGMDGKEGNSDGRAERLIAGDAGSETRRGRDSESGAVHSVSGIDMVAGMEHNSNAYTEGLVTDTSDPGFENRHGRDSESGAADSIRVIGMDAGMGSSSVARTERRIVDAGDMGSETRSGIGRSSSATDSVDGMVAGTDDNGVKAGADGDEYTDAEDHDAEEDPGPIDGTDIARSRYIDNTEEGATTDHVTSIDGSINVETETGADGSGSSENVADIGATDSFDRTSDTGADANIYRSAGSNSGTPEDGKGSDEEGNRTRYNDSDEEGAATERVTNINNDAVNEDGTSADSDGRPEDSENSNADASIEGDSRTGSSDSTNVYDGTTGMRRTGDYVKTDGVISIEGDTRTKIDDGVAETQEDAGTDDSTNTESSSNIAGDARARYADSTDENAITERNNIERSDRTVDDASSEGDDSSNVDGNSKTGSTNGTEDNNGTVDEDDSMNGDVVDGNDNIGSDTSAKDNSNPLRTTSTEGISSVEGDDSSTSDTESDNSSTADTSSNKEGMASSNGIESFKSDAARGDSINREEATNSEVSADGNRDKSEDEVERLLWSTPRSGGFNNQLISIYEGIRCAQLLGRTLVLPMLFENVRNDTTTKGVGPFPFEDYFDVAALASVVRVTTPADLELRREPICDGRVLYASSKHFYATERRQPRLFKQQYRKRFGLEPVFEPNLAKEDSAALHESELCVDDSACDAGIYTRPDEFGAYSDYADDGQGYTLRRSPRLKAIRAALVPSQAVKAIAAAVLARLGPSFNALHVRRGDFKNKCEQLPSVCERYGAEALWQTSEGIRERVSTLDAPELPLFVSTTHADECRELLHSNSAPLLFMEDVALPAGLEWAANRTDIVAYASQLVASRAAQFIGNRFSSYSTSINYMRILNNLDEKTLFF